MPMTSRPLRTAGHAAENVRGVWKEEICGDHPRSAEITHLRMAGHAAPWIGDGETNPAARIASHTAGGRRPWHASKLTKGVGQPEESLTLCLLVHAAISAAVGGGPAGETVLGGAFGCSAPPTADEEAAAAAVGAEAITVVEAESATGVGAEAIEAVDTVVGAEAMTVVEADSTRGRLASRCSVGTSHCTTPEFS